MKLVPDDRAPLDVGRIQCLHGTNINLLIKCIFFLVRKRHFLGANNILFKKFSKIRNH